MEIENFAEEWKRRAAEIKVRQESAPRPPSVRSICLDHTLYTGIQLNPERDKHFLDTLKFGAPQFDAHCVYCGRDTTFRAFADRTPHDVAAAKKMARFQIGAKDELKRLQLEDGQFSLHLTCSRNHNHMYSYFFSYDNEQAILNKIGQTPSLEDVAGAEIERYRKILGNEFAELRKATGLFAHGIGIGSFVYLRRVFENLVESAKLAADPEGEREAEFNNMRMAERISALTDYLPPAVVKYKAAYGLMSKGLHELTETECRKYFPLIRAAVILMLEQKYEAAQKAKAEADLERAFAAINSKSNDR